MPEERSAEQVVMYIRGMRDFKFVQVEPPYGHLGATLADAVLQANNRYDSNVVPRIKRILSKWPSCTTSSSLLNLLKSTPATQFLNWSGEDRAQRFVSLVNLLNQDKVETETDLRVWLEAASHCAMLRTIRGIGPKTVDYLKILVGSQSVAIDRRLIEFLHRAGVKISANDYDAASRILHEAAALLGLPPADLDKSIWQYMDGGQLKSKESACGA